MNDSKESPSGIMIIAVLWILTSIFIINWGLDTVLIDIEAIQYLPELYDLSDPYWLNLTMRSREWISFGLPAEMVLSFSIVVLSFLTVFTAVGLYTAKSWSYKSAFAIPVFTAIVGAALIALNASAPAEIWLASDFYLYYALTLINAGWIAVLMVYLTKPSVKQFIIGSSPKPISPKAPPSPISVPHAGTKEGNIIKAIVSHGRPLTWREISDTTGLDEKPLNRALYELIASEEIHKVDGKYNVSRKVLSAYQEFPNQQRNELISWINQWKDVRKLDFSLEHEHFFLEGRHLDDFSKELISRAKSEVIIVNPFIQDCDLSNTLREAKKRGLNVQILTRQPRDKYPEQLKNKREYHAKLKREGISLVYKKKVHAKIILVDRAVAIVSSMNLYPDSSAGVSWEAGLVSIEEKVVDSIVDLLPSRFI